MSLSSPSLVGILCVMHRSHRVDLIIEQRTEHEEFILARVITLNLYRFTQNARVNGSIGVFSIFVARAIRFIFYFGTAVFIATEVVEVGDKETTQTSKLVET